MAAKAPTPAAAAALWQDGWYRPARRCVSPNFGQRPALIEVDLLVLHSISLPPGQYGGEAVFQLFTNTLDSHQHPYFKQLQGVQVSSHFFIRRDGALWQFVSCAARAWHAGVSHYRGRDNCNDDSIGIELEGLEGERFAAAQYAALVPLCLDLNRCYPIRHVAGHQHIAPGRKHDPGAGFDWLRLQHALGWDDSRFP